MEWSVEFLDEDVQAELFAMPLDIRASFERIVRLIHLTASKGCASFKSNIWKGRFGKCV